MASPLLSAAAAHGQPRERRPKPAARCLQRAQLRVARRATSIELMMREARGQEAEEARRGLLGKEEQQQRDGEQCHSVEPESEPEPEPEPVHSLGIMAEAWPGNCRLWDRSAGPLANLAQALLEPLRHVRRRGRPRSPSRSPSASPPPRWSRSRSRSSSSGGEWTPSPRTPSCSPPPRHDWYS